MAEDRRLEVIAKAGLPALTEHTITNRKQLLAQLDRIREEGFASTYEELEVGLNAAAVPVRDHTGAVVGALSVSGPAFRFDRERIEATAADLRQAGDDISHRMGWLG
jgi:DNA-binding IclR family transcriptional regulator